MKKLRILFVGLVLIGTAPVVKGQTVGWQVRSGIGIAGLVGGVSNIDSRSGWTVGGGADIALSHNGVWRLQPMLQYAQKGWTFDGYFGDEMIMPAHYATRLSYIELPVMAAARLRIGKEAFITFRLGPYLSCGLNAKTKMVIREMEYDHTFGNHFSEACDFWDCAYDGENRHVSYPQFRRWDFGVAQGIDLTVNHVIIGLNSSFGLTPLADVGFMGNPVGNILNSLLFGPHPKNFTMGVSLGWQF